VVCSVLGAKGGRLCIGAWLGRGTDLTEGPGQSQTSEMPGWSRTGQLSPRSGSADRLTCSRFTLGLWPTAQDEKGPLYDMLHCT
jgi:hypothetical protein